MRSMWLFYISQVKNRARNLTRHYRRTSGFSSAFLFLMIKRREKEGGKAFFGFRQLVLTVSLFTDKNLGPTIGSSDINIYLPSNIVYDKVSISDTAEVEP